MKIDNFSKAHHLEVDVGDYPSGRYVCLRQRGQSMAFQMDITPKEARKFAQALLRFADIAEDGNEAKTLVAVDGDATK